MAQHNGVTLRRAVESHLARMPLADARWKRRWYVLDRPAEGPDPGARLAPASRGRGARSMAFAEGGLSVS